MQIVKSQVESTVDQFRSSTTNNFLLSLALNRNATQVNALFSTQATNFAAIIFDGSIIMMPQIYGNSNCFYSSLGTIQAGIYSYPDATPLFTVPGFLQGCFVIDALLQSDLRCFYNQSCISQLETYLLSTFAINVTAFDASLSREYLPNSTFQQLLDKLMIEEWNVTQMYDQYYNASQPTECTYNIVARNDIIYIVTTSIGIVGGLTTVLKAVIPQVVQLIFYCVRKWKKRIHPQIPSVQP